MKNKIIIFVFVALVVSLVVHLLMRNKSPGNSDFDYFRPDQAVPEKPKDIIAFARAAYRRIGLIRNAIDLMGDFASQGITLVHPNKKIERFYKKWFQKVGGRERSERFLRTF